MKNILCRILGISLFVCAAAADAQFSFGPLNTFGTGGWLAPSNTAGSTYAYLQPTGGNERGLAYGNGHLYLSSGTATSPALRILNPVTGADIGALDITGVAGGARVLVNLGVGADGAIYGANLQTALGTTAPFTVYKWANESTAPIVVYSGAPLAGARLGDSFDVIGTGASTRVIAGFGSTPSIAGNNGYVIIDPTLGTSTTVGFSGTPPAAGDFRLGLTFAGTGTVIGNQGGATNSTRWTTVSGPTGTLVGSLNLSAVAERQMDYQVVGGLPLLATVETTSSASGGTVRVYDMSNPLTPLLLGTAKTATSSNANANATGAIAWGNVSTNNGIASAQLFALNSNNGIEGFLVTVPEPSTIALAVVGLGLALYRRSRG